MVSLALSMSAVCITAASANDELKFELNDDKRSYTLSSCSVKTTYEVDVPDLYNSLPVTAIGEKAFFNCASLYKIKIGKNVNDIGSGAFYGCGSLKEIDIESGNFVKANGAIYTSDMKTLVYVLDRTVEAFEVDALTQNVNGYCFADMTRLINVDLKNVSCLGEHCFAYCTSLSLVDLPSAITEYPEYLFSGCTSLLAVSAEPTVNKIGEGCFLNCKGLRSVLVPDDTYVGENAFWGCDNATVYCATRSSCEAIAEKCDVTVKNVSFTGQRRVKTIFINPTRSLYVGEKTEINSGLVGDNIEVRYYFYVSSNPDVIEISDKTAVAKSVGKSTVYVYSVDGLKIDSREIEVVEQNVLLESEHNYSDNLDETKTYTLPGKPSKIKITFSTQTYTEPDEDFIFIADGEDNSYGAYSGNELAGRTFIIDSDTIKIRLTSDDSVNYFGYSLIEIVSADSIAFPNKINLSHGELKLNVGEEKKIDIELLPADAYSGKIYYRISDPSIANVDNEGNVGGICEGETYLTVFSQYGTATAQCKITVSDNSRDGFVYRISNNEAEIVYYKGAETNVVIPEKTDDYPVTKIAAYAFSFNALIESVNIPSSVKTVSPFAFSGCSSLEVFTVSEKNTYYKAADNAICSYDGITLVCVPGAVSGTYTISDEIKTVLCGAIGYNYGITAVTLGKSTEFIEQGAFEGCTSLTSFKVNPENKHFRAVNGSLYSYDKSSFVLCPTGSSGEISISVGTEKIYANAFYKCNQLKKIIVPKSVKSIDPTAFFTAGALTEISIDTSNSVYRSVGGCVYTSDMKTLVCVPCGLKDELTVEDVTETIGEYALANSSLSNIGLPYKLKNISAYAFYGADSLASLVLTPYVETLGEHCFDNCSGIVIYSPDGITSIGVNDFNGKFYCAEGSTTEQSLKKADILPLYCTYCHNDDHMLIAFSGKSNLKKGSNMNIDAFSYDGKDVFKVEFTFNGEKYVPAEYVCYMFYRKCENGETLRVSLSDGTSFTSNGSQIEFISNTDVFYLTPSKLERRSAELMIKALPNKTEYVFGEALDTSGLALYLLSPDGTVTVITDGYKAECELDKNGENTVYISYSDAVTKYSVTVSASQFKCNAVLSGNNTVGSTLSLKISDVSPFGMKYEIDWYRNGILIKRNAGIDYTVVNEDMGKTLYAEVKAANGFEGSVVSNGIDIKITEISSEIYCIDKSGSMISKIPLQTAVKDFIKGLSPSELLTVKKGDNAVSESSFVGTGMTVELALDGVVYQKLNIVVTGDINGDGKVTVTDFVKLKTRIITKIEMDGFGEKGADVNGDGKVTVTDFVQMKTHILGNGRIIAKEAK